MSGDHEYCAPQTYIFSKINVQPPIVYAWIGSVASALGSAELPQDNVTIQE